MVLQPPLERSELSSEPGVGFVCLVFLKKGTDPIHLVFPPIIDGSLTGYTQSWLFIDMLQRLEDQVPSGGIQGLSGLAVVSSVSKNCC